MTMHNPPHPGEFIRETYIEPFDISIRSLAESLGWHLIGVLPRAFSET